MKRALPRPRKSLGQHFLHDPNIVRKILDAARIDPNETVLEIGPGRGALTAGLSDRAGRVIALELDAQLARHLRTQFADRPNVELITADALHFPFDQIPAPFKVVANLPYNVATPILFRLLEVRARIDKLIVMVQRELAERMVAQPGGHDWGPLGVALQYFTTATILFRVAPGGFTPPPRVDSAVVRLVPRPNPPVAVHDQKQFFSVVRGAFTHRRKTLRNALRDAGFPPPAIDAALAAAGIDPKRRPETVMLEEFARLADGLHAHGAMRQSG